MKRIISAILSFVMLCAIGLTPAYAMSEDSIESEINVESAPGETDIFVEDIGNQISDLDSELVTLTEPCSEYAVSDISNSTIMDIDLSSAINVTEEFTGRPAMLDTYGAGSPTNPAEPVVPVALPENQPPVDNTEFLFLNPESLKDGQFTTDSRFFLVTRYNNVDLCYDPDGTAITFEYTAIFPWDVFLK